MSTARSYYVKDHLGSTRAVVSESGAVIERHDYDAYGMELAGRGQVGTPVLNERYTGHQRDAETGLDYFGARYYMPEIGRFLSTDPMNEYASPYSYVGANPVSLSDPAGLTSYDDWDRNAVRGRIGVGAVAVTDVSAKTDDGGGGGVQCQSGEACVEAKRPGFLSRTVGGSSAVLSITRPVTAAVDWPLAIPGSRNSRKTRKRGIDRESIGAGRT